MHKHVQAFVQIAAEAFDLQGPVYEFGYSPASASLGASANPRDGIAGGRAATWEDDGDTERLADLQRVPVCDTSARTVMCLDTLEHIFEPARAMEEMMRILAPGGLLLICSARGNLQEPSNRYWQLTPQSLQRMMNPFEAALLGWHGPDQMPHTIFAIGCKPPLPDSLVDSIHRFMDLFQSWLNDRAAERDWWHQLRGLISHWLHPNPASAAGQLDHTARFLLHMPLGAQTKSQLLAGPHSKSKAGGRLDCTG